MRVRQFPFSALAGQDLMKSALVVNAVDPSIGGVLVRGEKGTGKTTAVRSLASILPPIRVVRGCAYHCAPDEPEGFDDACRERFEAGEVLPEEEIPTPLVDLPLNATEDRLAGSMRLEEAVASGRRVFEPGLLAAANRGILYIDEVNLLEDHLVDMLLDAASTGINRVEREGISFSHPASFMLVGTMNPEEGELRPQFLDRFGLCVSVSGGASEEERLEVLTRRLSFERDFQAFQAAWRGEDEALARQIGIARGNLSGVAFPEAMLCLAARICAQAGASGHRAEIAIMRTAAALAAFTQSPRVLAFHIQEAARLALPHRMRQDILEGPENAVKKIDAFFGGKEGASEKVSVSGCDFEEGEGEEPPEEYTQEFGVEPALIEDMQVPGAMAAGSIVFSYLKKKLQTGGAARER
jgi:Mg-chelatase subunit ChlI